MTGKSVLKRPLTTGKNRNSFINQFHKENPRENAVFFKTT
jgi:hypothetical protein